MKSKALGEEEMDVEHNALASKLVIFQKIVKIHRTRTVTTADPPVILASTELIALSLLHTIFNPHQPHTIHHV